MFIILFNKTLSSKIGNLELAWEFYISLVTVFTQPYVLNVSNTYFGQLAWSKMSLTESILKVNIFFIKKKKNVFFIYEKIKINMKDILDWTTNDNSPSQMAVVRFFMYVMNSSAWVDDDVIPDVIGILLNIAISLLERWSR